MVPGSEHIPTLELRLLQSPEIRLSSGELFKLSSAKAEALLYYLAIYRRAHTRSALAALLWGDQPEEAARSNLRRALVNLGSLADDYMVMERQMVAMRPQGYWVDALEFEATASKAIAGRITDELPLNHALSLYQGDFLDGFYVRGAPDFDAWMYSERARLRELFLRVLESLAHHAAGQNDLAQAIRYGRRILEYEPWREEIHRQLMLWLAQSGQRGAALTQYGTLVQVLSNELAVEPATETVALYKAIQQGSVSLLPPPPVPLETERRQVDSAPLPVRHPRPSALALPRDRLIGRDQEVIAVSAFLLRDAVGLITLTGPPGVGKTRVALAVAAQLEHQIQSDTTSGREIFADGIWLVDLAAISDSALVPAAIAQALNLRDGVEQGLQTVLGNYLQEKRLLLVLDNFEHLMAAAPFLAELLNDAPKVKALVTSRAALRLRQEYEVAIAPLPLPNFQQSTSVDQLIQNPAVALFVARAQAQIPTFSLTSGSASAITDICIRLDGLPLAIELAAARIKLLTPDLLRRRLEHRLSVLTGGARDLPPRQQTLRKMLDWSYQLLETSEQWLFACLAVFVGGWTLEAVEALCSTQGAVRVSVLDGLQSLIDKNLVKRDLDTRFSLLETLREYALEQLEASGIAEDLSEQHAAYFLQIANEGSRHLFGHEQQAMFVTLDTEYGNLRAALEWWSGRGNLMQMLALTSALGDYWFQRGNFREGLGWLEQSIGQVRSAGYQDQYVLTEAYGLVLHHAGRLVTLLRNDYGQANAWHEEALAVGRRIDNPRLQGRSLNRLAQIASYHDDYSAMDTYFAESLALWQRLNDEQQIAATLNGMGFAAQRMQKLDEAVANFTQAATLWRTNRNLRALSFALGNLSRVRCEQGLLTEAKAIAYEGVKICEQLGPEVRRDRLLSAQGWIAYHEGNYAEAQAFHAEALAIAERYEVQSLVAACCYDLAVAHFAQRNLEEAAQLYMQSLTGSKMLYNKLRALTGIAELLWSRGHKENALYVSAAVSSLLERHGLQLDRVARLTLAQVIAQARAQLSKELFDTAWDAGARLSMERLLGAIEKFI